MITGIMTDNIILGNNNFRNVIYFWKTYINDIYLYKYYLRRSNITFYLTVHPMYFNILDKPN